MKQYILFIAIIFSFSALAKKSLLSKEERIIKNLERQITIMEKAKLKKQFKAYRLLNLKLEVNKQLLISDAKFNFKHKHSKKHLSQKANQYFSKINGEFFSFRKKYKNSKYLPALYYNFSIIAADLQEDEVREKYLLRALARTNKLKDGDLYYKINIGLAEFYYNEKKHEKAVKHYEMVKGPMSVDYWYPKYIHNYSWSQFKLGKKQEAINNLVGLVEGDAPVKYVVLTDVLYDAIVAFYSIENRFDDAFAFLNKNPYKNPHYYIKLGKYAAQAGSYKDSLNYYNMAEQEQPALVSQTYLLKANLYFEFKKTSLLIDHFNNINEELLTQIGEGKLELLQMSMIVYNQLLNRLNIDAQEDKTKELVRMDEVIKFTARINKDKEGLMLYTVGEHFYAINKYTIAKRYYLQVLDKKSMIKDKALVEKTYISLFAMHDSRYVQIKKDQLTAFYFDFLKTFPKHVERKNMAYKARDLLLNAKDYKNYKILMTMLNKNKIGSNKEFKEQIYFPYIDLLNQENESSLLREEFENSRRSKFKLSKLEKTKIQDTYYALIFKINIEHINNQKYEVAAKNLKQIFYSKRSLKQTKAIAALYLAQCYVEKDNEQSLKKWLEKSYLNFGNVYPKKYLPELETLLSSMFVKNNYESLAQATYLLSRSNVGKLGKRHVPFVEQGIYYNLIQSHSSRASLILKKQGKYLNNSESPYVAKTFEFLSFKRKFDYADELSSYYPQKKNEIMSSYFKEQLYEEFLGVMSAQDGRGKLSKYKQNLLSIAYPNLEQELAVYNISRDISSNNIESLVNLSKIVPTMRKQYPGAVHKIHSQVINTDEVINKQIEKVTNQNLAFMLNTKIISSLEELEANLSRKYDDKENKVSEDTIEKRSQILSYLQDKIQQIKEVNQDLQVESIVLLNHQKKKNPIIFSKKYQLSLALGR